MRKISKRRSRLTEQLNEFKMLRSYAAEEPDDFLVPASYPQETNLRVARGKPPKTRNSSPRTLIDCSPRIEKWAKSRDETLLRAKRGREEKGALHARECVREPFITRPV